MSPSRKPAKSSLEKQDNQSLVAGPTVGHAEIDTSVPDISDREDINAEFQNKAALALQFLHQVRAALKLDGDRPATDSSLAGATPTHASPTTLPQQIGRYRIIRSLGRGGFAEVFLAEDESLDRHVALKLPLVFGGINSEFRRRFEREARSAAMLSHPNIVPVYEFDCAGPIVFIAYRWFPGINLAQWLAKSTSLLSSKSAAEVVARLAEAVEHAHQRGVIHRDLKPANILVHESGDNSGTPLADRLLITDFGLARQLNADHQSLTQEGSALGTPTYMSPEQAAGRRETTAATDVWSLGVILYELLTGRVPFQAESALATIQSVQRDPVIPVRTLKPQVPRDLAAICHKCLGKEPRSRYRTAFELAEDLQRWLNGFAIHARTPTLREKIMLWIQRNPVVATATGFALLFFVSGLAGTTWQWRQARANMTRYKAEFNRAEENLVAANRALENERLQRVRAQRIAKWLGNTYRIPDPRLEGREVKVIQLLERAEKEIAADFGDDDETRWTLLLEIGKAWYGLGENMSALVLLRQVQDEQLLAGRPDDETTIELLQFLSSAQSNKGEFDTAFDLIKQAEGLAVRFFGEPGLETLKVKHHKATVLANLGRIDESMVLRHEIVDQYRNSTEVNDKERLEAERSLANGMVQKRDLAGAESLLESLIPELETKLGIDHPTTLAAKNDYANVLQHQNRLSEIVELRRDIVESTERVMGRNHPQTFLVLNNLALILSRIGQKREAIECWNDQLERGKICFGEQSPWYFLTLLNPANTYRELGELDEALSRYEAGVPGLQNTLGRTHAKTIPYHRSWLELLEQDGQYHAALQGWSEIREIELEKANQEQTLGSESAALRQSILRIRLGETDSALQSANDFLGFLQAAEFTDEVKHTLTMRTCASVLQALVETQNFSSAGSWSDRLMTLAEIEPDDSLQRLTARWFHAAVLAGTDRTDLARPVIEKLLDVPPAILGEPEKFWIGASIGALLERAKSPEHPFQDLIADLQAWLDLSAGTID